MAFTNYEANFSAVLPIMRATSAIKADIDAATSGRAIDISKSKLAEIEARIANGDDLYRRRQYEPALNAFRTARASIYALLYPSFQVGPWVASKDIKLPISQVLENGLLETSLRITDSLRPLTVERTTAFRQTIAEPVPPELAAFTQGGFHEALAVDQTLQEAAAESVALLQDGKAEAAIDILSNALARAANSPGADTSITSAIWLNLASALIQSGDTAKAADAATQARVGFESERDLIGVAQATHAGAVAARKAGDTKLADQLFARGAEALQTAASSIGVSNMPHTILPTRVDVGIGGGTPVAALEPTLLTEPVKVAALASRDISMLKPIADKQASALTVRVPGRADGWSAVSVPDQVQTRQLSKPWALGIPKGSGVATFKFASNAIPSANDLVATLYRPRIAAALASDLQYQIVDTSSTALYLTQLYAYALLVKIGDCYHELGQFALAESNYQQAAAYSYLNAAVEATSLWMRIANNALEWGEALYKDDQIAPAQDQYAKLIGADATVPNSFLYTAASLASPTNAARNLIQNLQQRPLPEINWEIAYLVLTAFSRLQQIAQGLDYYGLLLSPIHTFEYLQSVARGFAEEAIQAEREFVNFKARQEAAEATRRELETVKAMAKAEEDGRLQQWDAAKEDEKAAGDAVALATKRKDDAKAEKDAYDATSAAEIWARAAAQALGGGQDGMFNEISELADKLDRGETIHGPGPKLAAAQTLSAGRKTRKYELQKMQDNIDELEKNILVAQGQLEAAKKRTAAAETAYLAAQKRSELAVASLAAFDNQFFTPEAWDKMGNVMRSISRDYLYRAIRIAKLMERAYNFDNDTDLKVIKNDYGFNIATPAAGRDIRLLGGDSLLQDIDSFTYNAIATKTRKSSRIKDVISIANNFPAQFESFRRTGLLSFETDLYEFDRRHPGFFAQRLEAVEVEMIGVLPEGGMNGTLSSGGVTAFRRKDHTAGKRTHVVDTMALSDFVLRGDSFLYGTDTGVRGLFQGFGLGATWQLHLPKRSNAFDFRRIFDINLVLYYNAQFDASLRSTVLALPPRDGELSLLRTFGMRSDFPDGWYMFYRGGAATIHLDALRLPANQTNFKIETISFRVVTRDGVSNENIDMRITGPDGTTGTQSTDASGMVSSERAGLADLASKNPVGEWKVEVLDGASLKDNGALRFDRVYNVQIGLEYAFDYVPEVL